MSFRDDTIKAVKSMGITARELGITPRIIEVVPHDFSEAVMTLIHECGIDPETARTWIPEEYWEELGLANQYKIVEVELERTVTRKIYVAVPNDVPDSEAEGLIEDENFEMEDLCDEGYWDVAGVSLYERDLTEDDILNDWGDYALYNYDTFRTDCK